MHGDSFPSSARQHLNALHVSQRTVMSGIEAMCKRPICLADRLPDAACGLSGLVEIGKEDESTLRRVACPEREM
jgi:hypothetical protein